ncbi:sulfatase [Catalinimonas niigatensis]|uniref:sulfatase n=1 Tax=Catalinimonas niigatensis TaxID=1397264 RepID=UPI0026656BFA|nr:sulfatase [Catalinimonas niigatensis]WPP51893.1 sulfatase [Catalinimonas niigatensis]
MLRIDMRHALKSNIMLKRGICLILCSWMVLLVYAGEHDRPNILLIYADDLGYADLGCYGREYGNTLIDTPYLDQFAKEGVKFTQAYASAPLCSPSRAALLTGKSPARLGFEFVTKYEKDSLKWEDEAWKNQFEDKALVSPPYTLNLPLEEVSLAEALKAEGYTTGMVGKWHVASHYQKYKGWNPTYGPENQGFDWAKETFGAHPYSRENTASAQDKFSIDQLMEEAIHFIQKDHQNPFFLFVSHYYVHTPLDSKNEWLIEKYRKKAGEGVSEERIRYAAFVETLDHYVGQLLKALDEEGLADNTLVMFTSDNGGHPEFAYNRPFRGSKWNLYEGGIRVPLIARWPGVIDKTSHCDYPLVQYDFLPTFLEIANPTAKLKKPIDGISFLPILRGNTNQAVEQDRALIWHFPYYHPEGSLFEEAEADIGTEDGYVSKTYPQSSIRRGRYKLIYFYEEDKHEMYDLIADPSEKSDLSKQRPWDAKALKECLFASLFDMHARFPRKTIK